MNVCIYQVTSKSAFSPKSDLLESRNLNRCRNTWTVAISYNIFPRWIFISEASVCAYDKHLLPRDIVQFDFAAMPTVLLLPVMEWQRGPPTHRNQGSQSQQKLFWQMRQKSHNPFLVGRQRAETNNLWSSALLWAPKLCCPKWTPHAPWWKNQHWFYKWRKDPSNYYTYHQSFPETMWHQFNNTLNFLWFWRYHSCYLI